MHKETTGPIDIEALLINLRALLCDTLTNISTTPAYMMMYGVAILELNYAKIRLQQDRGLLKDAVIFSSAPGGFRVNYKEWYEKLKNARLLWPIRGYEDSTDDVCYEDPGFSFSEIKEKHYELWKRLGSELDEVLSLLSEMHILVNFPPEEKIVYAYKMLRDGYFRHEYLKDREKYELFKLSVPKRRDLREKKLRNQLFDYKRALFQSGILDEMCYEVEISDEELDKFERLGTDYIMNHQREGVLKMMYDDKSKKWDEDLIARYLFSNRSRFKTEQINALIRYSWQKDDIERELTCMNGDCNDLYIQRTEEKNNVSAHVENEKFILGTVFNPSLCSNVEASKALVILVKEKLDPSLCTGKRADRWTWGHVQEAFKQVGFVEATCDNAAFGRAMVEINGKLKAENVKAACQRFSSKKPANSDKNLIAKIVAELTSIKNMLT